MDCDQCKKDYSQDDMESPCEDCLDYVYESLEEF